MTEMAALLSPEADKLAKVTTSTPLEESKSESSSESTISSTTEKSEASISSSIDMRNESLIEKSPLVPKGDKEPITEQPVISNEPLPVTESIIITTAKPSRRDFDIFGSTATESVAKEESTSSVNPRHRVVLRTRVSSTEKPSSTTEAITVEASTAKGIKSRKFVRGSSTVVATEESISSTTGAIEKEESKSTEQSSRRTLFRSSTTEDSTGESISTTTETLNSQSLTDGSTSAVPSVAVEESTAKGIKSRKFFRGSSTAVPTEESISSTTDAINQEESTSTKQSLRYSFKSSTTESSTGERTTTVALSSSGEALTDDSTSTEATNRPSFLRHGITEENISSSTEADIQTDTTTEDTPTRSSLFISTTTEASRSDATKDGSTTSNEIESEITTPEPPTTRRSLFRNKTDAVRTTTTEAAETISTKRRPLIRSRSTESPIIIPTEGEKEVETSTDLPRRRVIIRGKYRPRQEGDLSSLLAADANKRVRNHQQSTEAPLEVKKSESNELEETERLLTSEHPEEAKQVKKFNTLRNRTTTKTENLGNGITRTRTTYVRTLDAGQKVVKHIHTKTIEEKPAEYEYIVDEVTRPPTPSTTKRSVTRNRGSVRFQSNDLSSLLALDFAPRNRQKAQTTEATVTKIRRRLLKRPKETVEHEEVEEYQYESGNEVEEEESPVSTTARAIIRRTRPTRGSTTTSTTSVSTKEANKVEASTRRTNITFKRPTKEPATTIEVSTETASTESTTKRFVGHRKPLIAKTTTSPYIVSETAEEETTENQLAAAKLRFVNRLRTSTTSTTTEPTTVISSTTEADLGNLKDQLTKAINRLQSGNRVENEATVKETVATDDESDDKLSLPIYHRRKYYQYVKDSPITYIDKSSAPPDIENVTVNIKQQIHDVFNVSGNETPNNSLDGEGENEDHRLAMEQAKEINAELGHFLLKTPGSK